MVRLTWLYVVLVIGALLVLKLSADIWWAATVLIYGPRWVLALPLLVLAPFAVRRRSWRSAMALSVAGLIVAGPITGGTVSPGNWWGGDEGRKSIRILTCNTDGKALNGSVLAALIADVKPDIIVLQEASSPNCDRVFPVGWQVSVGPGGLRLGTRFPIKSSEYLADKKLGGRGIVGRYLLETPAGELTVVNVHLPTPRDGFELLVHGDHKAVGVIRDQIAMRDRASANAQVWLGDLDPTVIVAGDFNMPAESNIYRRHWSHLGNAFSEVGWGWGFTKQTRWFGVRIDHVLFGGRWKCRKVWVGPDVGSDHLPLIADLE